MVAVLISRFLEGVIPVFPRLIFLGVLCAASGSAGFILEHYWSFLTVLFPFAEEGLAFGCLPNSWTLLLFVLTNVNNFLSTGILSSLIFCRRIYIFLGFCMHVSTLSLFAESTIFSHLGG